MLWITSVHLILLPWALGTARLWAQIPSLALGAIAFAVALFPRNYTEAQTGSDRFRLLMWPKLVRFPIFWLGLALLGYIALQAYNPSWEYQSDDKSWWMKMIPHLSWLPTGVRAPFERSSPTRMILVYSACWLTACSVWVGFTRRRSLQLLLTTLMVNGVALATLGVAQRMLGNQKMFWFWDSPNKQFFASFIYKNHGGIYLDLMVGVTAGLAAWHYLKGLRYLKKSDPSVVIAFLAVCIAASVLISQASGATMIMFAFASIGIAAFIVHQIRLPRESRRPLVTVALLALIAMFLAPSLPALGSNASFVRLKRILTREDWAFEQREEVTKASIEMLRDHWKVGAGAGSFRYLFTTYQHRHPNLVVWWGQRLYWEHAHNDILQFPIELGLFGALVILFGAFWFAVDLIRHKFWDSPVSMSIATILLLIVVYSWWDFPFQNPAVLTTFCVLCAVSTAWVRMEESGGGA